MQLRSVMHADSVPAGSVSELGSSDEGNICLLGDLGLSGSLDAPNMVDIGLVWFDSMVGFGLFCYLDAANMSDGK